ncbi:MAG: rhomboid family intramembrane serine protease [Myxococcota bacterium]|nr:rhomboid family intramembrane serine protease [Myxococcota bacterium]
MSTPARFELAFQTFARMTAPRGLIGLLCLYFSNGLLSAPGPLRLDSGSGLGMLAVACGVYLVFSSLRRLRSAYLEAVILGDDFCVLPRALTGGDALTLTSESLSLLVVQRSSNGSRLVVGHQERRIPISAAMFADPEDLSRVHDGIVQRLVRSPEMATKLQNSARQMGSLVRLFRRKAPFTESITGVLLAVYVLELAMGALSASAMVGGQPGRLIELGANVSFLTLDGQYDRLFTSTLLHGGLIHIYFNGMALWVLGGMLERLLGWHRVCLIYLVSGFVGALASTFLTKAFLGIGASGAVFGLLGALGALQLRFSSRMPQGLGQSRRWWVIILGLNGALPFLVPQIDLYAHLGGFLAGFVTCWVAAGARFGPMGADAPSRWVRHCAVGCLALAAVSVVQGVARYSAGEKGEVQLLAAMSQRGDVEPSMVTWFAWSAAIGPDSDRLLLETAEKALRPHALITKDSALLDTLATLKYRLGDRDDAVQLELQVLDERKDTFTATQLARFLLSDFSPANAPAYLIGGDTPRIEWVDQKLSRSGRLFFPILDGVRLRGLATIKLKAGRRAWPKKVSVPAGRHPLAWARPGGDDLPGVKVWGLHKDAATYP